MILCSCNVISDKHVREAYENGARTPKAVYRYFGTKPNCGTCIASFVEALETQRRANFALGKPAA